MSDVMSFETFCEEVAEILVVEPSDLIGQDLTQVEEFDSMGKINVGLMIEESFAWQIPFNNLDGVSDIKAIYDLCCENKGKG